MKSGDLREREREEENKMQRSKKLGQGRWNAKYECVCFSTFDKTGVKELRCRSHVCAHRLDGVSFVRF